MEVVDGETGEVTSAALAVLEPAPSIDGLIALFRRIELALGHDARPLETIPADLAEVEKTATAIFRWWKRCQAVVLARMVDRNAKRIGDPKKGPAMSVKTDTEWTFDEAQLKHLLDVVGIPDGITADEYEAAMRYKFTPDKRVLNELAKRGGKVAEIINLGVRGTPKHKLVLEGAKQ